MYVKIVSLFILIGLAGCAGKESYYVDPAGDDGNSGRSIAKPWRTLETVNPIQALSNCGLSTEY